MKKLKLGLGIIFLVFISLFIWFSFGGYKGEWVYRDEIAPYSTF